MSWLLALFRALPALIDGALKLAAALSARRAQSARTAKDARNDDAIAVAQSEKKP